jgi:hypothetical protein
MAETGYPKRPEKNNPAFNPHVDSFGINIASIKTLPSP